MTSETPNLHVLKNLNISKTEKDIEKLKTPLRLVWKCCSDAFQIGSTIFRRRGTLKMLSIPFCASVLLIRGTRRYNYYLTDTIVMFQRMM